MTDVARDAAIETLCDARLHQSFILPASALPNTDINTPLRITYSDIGYIPPHSTSMIRPKMALLKQNPNPNHAWSCL
jgi:hypothetical protein